MNAKNLTNNPIIKVINRKGSMMVLEHKFDKSVHLDMTVQDYFITTVGTGV